MEVANEVSSLRSSSVRSSSLVSSCSSSVHVASAWSGWAASHRVQDVMLCVRPVKLGVSGPFACGRCRNCRINRRREWTGRLLLHHCGHEGASAFVTLTYRPEEVHVDDKGRGVLWPVDIRNFLQRVRRSVGPLTYVVVGEYGERSGRPHYHALLWVPDIRTDVSRVVGEAWDVGFVHVGDISEASIAYTCAYVLKRMTSEDDERLEGRPPEFGRYSHGLGVPAIAALRAIARPNVDGVLVIPREFRIFGKRWPIPRYIRRKLREEGYEFEKSQGEVQEREFVSLLRECSAAAAAEELARFRAEVAGERAVRQEQARVRSTRNLEVKRHETF